MDLYPFNLVLAVAIASATVVLGTLPTRLIRAPVFTRQALGAGLAWIAVGVLSPLAIVHYDVLLGFLCLFAWRRLRHDRALSGKMWLCAAAGLGISLGVVLILAVTPQAWPPDLFTLGHCLLLASLYLGGGVIGLAYMLYVFTRPEATRAGIPAPTVHRLADLLLGLILARAAIFLFLFLEQSAGDLSLKGGVFWTFLLLEWALFLVLFPSLGWFARRRALSQRPSSSGPTLIRLALLAMAAEIVTRLFATG